MNGMGDIETMGKLKHTDLIGPPAPQEAESEEHPRGRPREGRIHLRWDPEANASQKDSRISANSSFLLAKAKMVFR